MARPVETVIDWDDLDKLCGFQCTAEETAIWFNCSVDTLDRHCKKEHGVSYAEYFKTKRKRGHISLRRKQWELAMKGDKTMLIWLGKQYLGQSEKITEKIEAKVESSDDIKQLAEDTKQIILMAYKK